MTMTNQPKFYIARSDNDAVGLWSEYGILTISFPMGYSLNVSAQGGYETDDIGNLVRLLYSCMKEDWFPAEQGDETNFPIFDYLNILNYFVEHNCSYYKEYEVVYEERTSGKISWTRTIKQTRPIFADGQAFYLSTIRKHNALNDLNLITEINKYCVYRSVELLGSLYGLNISSFEKLEREPDSESKLLYWVEYLKKKMSHTYIDSSKSLFNSMIIILTRELSGCSTEKFSFMTDKFHVIWEQMVDKIFGNVNGGSKQLYYPNSIWQFYDGNGSKLNKTEETNKLRPDSILIKNNTAYIIDAKYYQFGLNLVNPTSTLLPQASSIFKQFAYLEHSCSKITQNPDAFPGVKYVCNKSPFILPFDGADNGGAMMQMRASTQSENQEVFVYAILFDTKSAIDLYLNGTEQDFNKVREDLIKTICVDR